MNTTASHTASDSAAETTLGWNAMPAYGEVMSELKGLSHLEMPATGAPATKTNLFMESFWNSVRSQFLTIAA